MKFFQTIKYTLSLLLAIVLPTTLWAQNEIPEPEDVQGDFILMNYKTYEGETTTQTSLAEVRPFKLTPKDEAMVAEGFYMQGMPSLEMNYIATTGNITILAGQVVFTYGDGNGSIMYLYPWDDRDGAVNMRPITYRYKGKGRWECNQTLVLMAGVLADGELIGDLTPYLHSQGSVIVRANARVSDVAYDGEGVEFIEERPAYIVIGEQAISVYNMLQIDMHGNGAWVDFAYLPATGEAMAYPTLIGESPTDLNYPYKALTGCEYDETTHRPTDASHVILNGKEYEGLITSRVNIEMGEMTLSPMAVWPSSYSDAGWDIDLTRFYEVYSEMIVSFDPKEVASVGQITSEKENIPILHTEYFTPDGRLISRPLPGQIVIQRIVRTDGSTESKKMIKR